MDWKIVLTVLGVNAFSILSFVWYMRGWRSITDESASKINKVETRVDKSDSRIRTLEDDSLSSKFLYEKLTQQSEALGNRFDMWQKNNMETHKATAQVMASNQDQNTKIQAKLIDLINSMNAKLDHN